MPPFLAAAVPTIINLIANAFGLDTSSDEAKVKLAEIELRSRELLSQEVQAQTEVNKIEASSSNLFVSGWRPCIGWVCAISFASIVGELLYQWHLTGVQPNLDFVWAIMGSLLGIGAMRSYEKVKGVTK